MNKDILNLDYKDIMSVYISTVRQSEFFTEDNPYYNIWASKVRDQETGVILQTHDIIKRYDNKACFYPEWGKIICISIGYIHDNVIVTKNIVGEEIDILNEFVGIIKKNNRKILTHNHTFSIPFIRKRYTILNPQKADFPLTHSDSGRKPWETSSFAIDIMDIWKGIGMLSSSLNEIAMSCNIPIRKENTLPLDSDLVFYKEKNINKITEYCEHNASNLLNIIRSFKGDGIIDVVRSKDLKHKKGEDKEPNNTNDNNFICDIMNSGVVNKTAISTLRKKVNNELSKEQIVIAKDIILSAYLTPKASATENKEKETKLNNFFNKI